MVIWLTGVDYFSTIGYQPGIALLAAGAVSPIATAILVAVTLLCALPIYAQVAGRSYAGLGSIAMLENILPGWPGKVMVLVLLGFAATDFVITMTLSASDAAQHATQNPYLHSVLHDANLPVTLVLLALLAAVFLKGFKEAIELAAAVCVPYIVLNAVVMGRALFVVSTHPAAFPDWLDALRAQGDWKHLGITAAILFPRLALGLSGFETGVSVMPLINGDPDDATKEKPEGTIRNTKKLMLTAALLMSVLLMVSSFVSVLLVPKSAYQDGGPASGRVVAWMAHEYLGNVFGSVYDMSTILVLWFAGASAMAGLLHLVPRYLPRVGLAPEWVAYARPLVLMLFLVNVVVTLIFRANVEAQGGAYATGVLVLDVLGVRCGIALAVERRAARDEFILLGRGTGFRLHHGGEHHRAAGRYRDRQHIHFADSYHQRGEPLLARDGTAGGRASLHGRAIRGVVEGDGGKEGEHGAGAQLGEGYPGPARAQGAVQLQRQALVHLELLDNRSEFLSPLQITVTKDGEEYLVEATQAVAIANGVAYLSEILHPRSLYLGLSRQNLMRQSFRYFLLGEGETGLMVYTILQHHWEVTPYEDVRPCIYLMSD